MKNIIRWAGVYVVLFTALYLFVPKNLHRRDFDRAFTASIHNPSPETKAELERQQAINERIDFKIDAITALALTGIGYTAFVLLPRALQR